MRHRVAKKHLTRTPAHLKAMRRNLAQSLFQYGQIETTLAKAKLARPFVEKLITLARKGTLQSRQRVTALMNDRSILNSEEEEKYIEMTMAQRHKVMVARSGRRHRTGQVPAGYNKKKIPFVAQSIVRKLINEIAPLYKERPGGYTRIIHLAKRRIGDNSDLAILQLVGQEEQVDDKHRRRKKSIGLRRQKALDRQRYLEGKGSKRPGDQIGKSRSKISSTKSKPSKSVESPPDAPAEAESSTEKNTSPGDPASNSE